MKKVLLMVTLLVMSLSMSLPVLADGIQPLYVGNGSIQGQISRGAGTYSVVANSSSDTSGIEVYATLYEDGWFWDTKVDSCSKSANGSACSIMQNFTFEGSKNYILKYDATFHYNDGTSETISGSTTG